jgi:hypothetical protein
LQAAVGAYEAISSARRGPAGLPAAAVVAALCYLVFALSIAMRRHSDLTGLDRAMFPRSLPTRIAAANML